MRAHSRGVRGDSALCLLQYACLKLSKPGLASRPWHSLPPSLCQCQLQLGTVPAADARLSFACVNACSPLEMVSSLLPTLVPSILPLLGCLIILIFLASLFFSFFFYFLFAFFFLSWFFSVVLFIFHCFSIIKCFLPLFSQPHQVCADTSVCFCWLRLFAHVYADVLHQTRQLLAPAPYSQLS